jgi:hypothetical protein
MIHTFTVTFSNDSDAPNLGYHYHSGKAIVQIIEHRVKTLLVLLAGESKPKPIFKTSVVSKFGETKKGLPNQVANPRAYNNCPHCGCVKCKAAKLCYHCEVINRWGKPPFSPKNCMSIKNVPKEPDILPVTFS